MADNETIKTKVEKLLRLAADQEGTPEGDACRDKAFELMAQYGVEESQLQPEDAQGAVRRDVKLSGTYTDMQYILLNALGTELHCQVLMFRIPHSSRVQEAVLFGRKHHVDRVMMLYGVLSPTMILGATKMAEMWPDSHVSVTTQKRSWMRGFISQIATRLRDIESSYTEDYQRTSSDGSVESGGLVLRRDVEAGEDLMREYFPHVRRTRGGPRRFDPHSFAHGVREGTAADLGQTRVGGVFGVLPGG